MKVRVLSSLPKTKPGGHFTLFFEVENVGSRKAEASLQLPQNWQVIASRSSELSSTVSKYIFTVSSPSSAFAGSYQMAFVIRSGDRMARKITEAEVVTVRRVEVIPLTSYDYVREGDSLKLEYLVQNLGNHIEKVELRTTTGKIEINEDSLTLYPHKSIRVAVNQKIPETQNSYWEMSNGLFVSLQDSSNATSGFINLPVYSSKNRKSDPYLRYTLEAGAWYSYFDFNKEGTGSYQYDVKGSGFLDFKRKHYADFIVHGPNQITLPAVGSYDQYSLNYAYKKSTFVSAGDYLLVVNNLMEFGRFGRGLRVEQKIMKTGISLFYNQPRFYTLQKDTYGASFYYRPKETLVFSVDGLSKIARVREKWFETKMLGLTTRFKTPVLSFSTEIAVARTQQKNDFGAFNRLYLHVKKLQISSDLVYAGKNFYGFYHNSWQAVNAVNYTVFKKVSLGVQSNITRLNPSFDIYILNISPYYSSNTVFLNYEPASRHRITVSYNEEAKEDRQTVKQFFFNEKYGRLVYMVNSEKFQLWFENRYGQARNLLAGGDDIRYTVSARSVLQPQVRVFRWLWVGGFAEYQRNSKFSSGTRLENYYYYGGNMRIVAGRVFNASVSYRNNYAPDEFIQQRSFMDLTAELNTKHHRLSVMAGRMFLPYYTTTNEGNLFFTVRYTLKLNVPVAKNKNLGSIKGTLTGEPTTRRAGVLVNLHDKKFLTDAEGSFYFNDLPPDKYYLTLDRSTLESGIIPGVKVPFEVSVLPKAASTVSVPLVLSGSISGKILLKSDNRVGDPLPPVVLKLTNGSESYITRPNEKGEFSFREILPGKWQIQASVQGNSGQYEIENAAQEVVVEALQDQKVSFKIQKKERKIYFSDKSYQLISKK